MMAGLSLLAPVLLYLAAAAVFALDWFIPLGFSVSMLYIPICLAGLWLNGWRSALLLGAACSILMVVGLFVSPPGGPVSWSIVNRTIGFVTLWSALWGGRLFAQRTVELERTKAALEQEIDQRRQVEQAMLAANDQLESHIARRTEQLQGALDRWELVTQATHDGVYDWDLTTDRVVYTSHWKAMHGFSNHDDDESPAQWSERIHPDDRLRVLGHLNDYLAGARQEFSEEYRIRRRDGRWIWVLDRGIALRDETGRAVRLVGSEKDITERKEAEETLRLQNFQLEELTAKLLTAQEHERQRIARELHDDITQRLAALAVDLGSLVRACPPDPPLHARLREAQDTAGQLADDVHNFAYRLHPSLLEHLGLEAAIRDYVDEFRRRTGLAVRYVKRGITQTIPLDIATCLYRVMQEGLQNVQKHAAASDVLVALLATVQGVGVCVRDNGKGFAYKSGEVRQTGLGLVSMEERVRLMKGTFRLRTQPGKGTEIHAWVPLPNAALQDTRREETAGKPITGPPATLEAQDVHEETR
ncbi:MAG: PAS domain-containing protein [Nitrospira sp.]|nr:PAS domain-containing protein [Nitrospira sp.]MCP9461543.1 PAS domain-containing protein [Nitrospira sp.]MCP9476116.1 PAS domain-containing protein [Nitrospira sp.]